MKTNKTNKANSVESLKIKFQTFNGKQFEGIIPNLGQFPGVILINTTATGSQTALRLHDADCTPQNGTQDELFRCWRNVYKAFRSVKADENALRLDNDAIRSVLSTRRPSKIVFITKEGKIVESYDLEGSVWKNIGLVPTAKDLDLTGRDAAKAINAAAKASFTVIGMREIVIRESVSQATEKVEIKAPETVSEEVEKAA